jgi:hypothetical protein
MDYWKTIFLWMLALSSGAVRADWVSGGGELIKHSHNPWFLQNTREVTYCILADEPNMGHDLASLRKLVKSALDYWKAEFQNAGNLSNFTVRIADQTFIEKTCQDVESAGNQADVVFQFGILSAAQRAWLKNPTNYVGIAVRTEYDLENLRGKGFIYIAPQSGDDLKPRIPNFKEKIWQRAKGFELLRVIAHETGHMFGLRHQGSSLFTDLMSEGMPEGVVTSQEVVSLPVQPHKLSSFFGRSGKIDHAFHACAADFNVGLLGKLLGATGATSCFAFDPIGHGKYLVTELCLSSQSGCHPVKLGTLQVTQEIFEYEEGVLIYLPYRQRVFPLPEERILNAASIRKRIAGGTFSRASDGQNVPVMGTFEPNYIRMSLSDSSLSYVDILNGYFE